MRGGVRVLGKENHLPRTMCSELTYNSVRVAHQVREHEERKTNERRKHILCILIQYLRDEGYLESAEAVAHESGLFDQYEVCDNIDLPSIIKEFEDYYFVRFQKHPKLCKKTGIDPAAIVSHKTKARRKGNSKRTSAGDAGPAAGDGPVPASSSTSSSKPLELTVLAYPLPQACHGVSPDTADEPSAPERLLRPLAALPRDPEWRQFAEIISRDIFVHNPNVRWSDIKGLQEPKRLLREAVVYPIKYPELFSGILAPWKGLLLYGPSGTGKTLLAKAVATECGTTFFNVSASTLISKWRGDSEKLVRVLFELARLHAPSTIFLDEVDALASRRGFMGEHEASRRLQAELLVQLDGLNEIQVKQPVFLLVTSNLPWDLDEALLRRLEKRILVDLPDLEARKEILRHYLPPLAAVGPHRGGSRDAPGPALRCSLDYEQLAKETAGYSGADIRLVCKEAAMQAVRSVFKHLESGVPDCSVLQLDEVTTSSVLTALAKTKPCGAGSADRFRSWQSHFGAS